MNGQEPQQPGPPQAPAPVVKPEDKEKIDKIVGAYQEFMQTMNSLKAEQKQLLNETIKKIEDKKIQDIHQKIQEL